LYAILSTGGKQYRVSPGQVVRVEKLDGQKGDAFVFDRILAVSSDGDIKVGSPYLEGAQVRGTIVRQGKARKVLVFKYRAKTNYRRRIGHRQPFTEVRIDAIEA
jgi:large subunit ribosomal protein L21